MNGRLSTESFNLTRPPYRPDRHGRQKTQKAHKTNEIVETRLSNLTRKHEGNATRKEREPTGMESWKIGDWRQGTPGEGDTTRGVGRLWPAIGL